MTHTHIKVMNSFLIRVARVSGNTLFFFRFGIFLYFVFALLFVVFDIVCLFFASLFVVVVYLFSF